MASTHTVASDLSYRVFKLRKSRGELSSPQAHVGHQTAYIRRAVTVMDRFDDEFRVAVKANKARLSKG